MAGAKSIGNLVAHDYDFLLRLLICKICRERAEMPGIGAKPLLVSPIFAVIRADRAFAAQHVSFNRIERAEHLPLRPYQHTASLLARQTALDGAHNLLLPIALRMRR